MTTRVLLGLLAVLGGALAVNSGWRDFERARASEKWPMVTGEILKSGVETKLERTAGQLSSMYQPEILYIYTVDDRSYEGRTVRVGDEETTYGERSHAREVVQRYPAGRTVRVYHDPVNPGTSALEQGADPTVYFMLGVGAVFVAIGSWLMAGPLGGGVFAAWTGK